MILTNNGSAPLVVSAVILGGKDPADYLVEDGCQQLLGEPAADDFVRLADGAPSVSAEEHPRDRAVAGPFVDECTKRGLLSDPAGPRRIRFVTHYGIDAEDIQSALKICEEVLTA